MLAPGNYVQWKSRIKRYIDTKPNHELIHYCLENPPYKLDWQDIQVPVSEGSPITTTERIRETYKNVSQDIRDQLNAEVEAGESINVQDLETNLYWEFGKFTSQDGETLESYYSRFVTLVKQSQELTTVSYHKLYDILKQHQHEVNEIRAKKIARVANPLAPVAQQQPVYHPQNHPTHYTQNSLTRSQQDATRNRGKAIVNSSQPIYDQEPFMVAEDDETSKDKEIDKLMALISLSYENQRIGNVAGARETVEQADWRDDTDDDELEDQELEAHYMYMAQLQEVSPDAADSGPIFDDEPLQKVSNDDNYNVFAIESAHPEKSESVHDTYPIEQDAQIVSIDSLDMNYDREEIDQNDDDNDLAKECELLASLIEKLKCEIDESINRPIFDDEPLQKVSNDDHYNVFAMESTHPEQSKSVHDTHPIEQDAQNKETQIKLYKTREDKELEKIIELENKVKVLDNIVYKTGQSVQTTNMLNSKCRTSFVKPEFLKKAQRANPHLYDIGCYNDNLALMLTPNSDEVICLEKESQSKLSDLIRPFDYNKLNNMYDLFVPQCEKSSEQRYFSERSRLSHINVNNGKSKEFFNKQTTLLEKRMDESIPLDKQCQSSLEIFKVKSNVNMIITGVELFKQKIANRTYIGYIDPFIQSTIESSFCPVISRISAGLNQFLREYYYANHMNAILGVYTELDEVTNLQCDYLELLDKREGLETELSKSKKMSKSFESV
nr:hypothetical protein [Tanacetum cinerariifolium]